MTPNKYFESQAEFNSWLTELTETEKDSIVSMIDEYADIEAINEAKQAKTEMLKVMLENDSISRENYNYYYQKFCK